MNLKINQERKRVFLEFPYILEMWKYFPLQEQSICLIFQFIIQLQLLIFIPRQLPTPLSFVQQPFLSIPSFQAFSTLLSYFLIFPNCW